MKRKQNSFTLLGIVSAVILGILAFKVIEKIKVSSSASHKRLGSVRSDAKKELMIEGKKIKKAKEGKSSKISKKGSKSSSEGKVKGNSGLKTSNSAVLRQEQLLKYIETNKSLVMSEALKIFKDINERTLRRDLVSMVKAGLLKKHGSTKSTKYVLK